MSRSIAAPPLVMARFPASLAAWRWRGIPARPDVDHRRCLCRCFRRRCALEIAASSPRPGGGDARSPGPGRRRQIREDIMISWKAVFRQGSRLAGPAAALALLAGPAMAEDTITLKVAHLLPADVYIWKQGGQVMTDEITARTGGRVRFEVYPAGQLGKDMLSVLSSGIADIAFFVPQYSPDKLPLSTAGELPGLYDSSCEGTHMVWDIVKPGGLLGDSEYKAQGMRVLFANVIPPNVLMTTRVRPEGIEAIKGLKIRANGNAVGKTASQLGAVPIQAPVGELYDSLSRGTIDGTFYPYVSLPDFDLENLLKYSVHGPRFGGNLVGFAISEASWNKLPEDVRQIVAEAGLKAQDQLCSYEDRETLVIRDRIVAENGHSVVELTPEQIAQFEEKFEGVVAAWAQDMTKAGLDAQSVLDALKQ
ncbi:hypothetical protein DVR11_16095 [Paracoccus versutus]|nr:hypothetical protein DVR11_16095 [Paracoccus versutus]